MHFGPMYLYLSKCLCSYTLIVVDEIFKTAIFLNSLQAKLSHPRCISIMYAMYVAFAYCVNMQPLYLPDICI